MNEQTPTRESKKEGTPSKGTLQSYIQNYSKEAIDAIVEILRTTRNENLRLGAAKIIIDKSIPDIKAIELNGGINADGSTEPIRLLVNAGYGFVPASLSLQGTPTPSSTTAFSAVQSVDMASQSVENDNSNNGSSQTSTP